MHQQVPVQQIPVQQHVPTRQVPIQQGHNHEHPQQILNAANIAHEKAYVITYRLVITSNVGKFESFEIYTFVQAYRGAYGNSNRY